MPMPELAGLGVSRWPLGGMGFDSGPTYQRSDTIGGVLSGTTSGLSRMPEALFKFGAIVGEREQEAAKAKAKADANEATLKQAAARGVITDSLKILALDDYPNSAKKELYNRIIRKAIYDSFPQLGDWAPAIPENVPWGPDFTKHVKEFVAVVTAQNDQRDKELALQAMWGEMCANPKTAPLCKMQQDHLAAVRRDQVEVIAMEFGNILDGTATPAQVADFYAQKADAQHPGRHGEEEKDRLIRRERGLIITDGILLAEARRAAARKAAKEGFLPVPETSRLVDPLVLPSATPPAPGSPGMATGGVAAPAPGSPGMAPGGVAAPAPGGAPVGIEDIGAEPVAALGEGSVLPTTRGGDTTLSRGVVLEAAPKTLPPVQAAADTFARLRKENPRMTREEAATLALDQHGAVPEELRPLVDALVKADIAKAGKTAAETAGARAEADWNAPLGAANAANLFNPVTRQNPPSSMSQAEADKQGFRAIPPEQIKAINLLEANLKDAYGIIRRRKDLFPPATGSQTRDAYNIAQAKVLAVVGRASGDADIQTLDSLSGMLMHINRAFGGTSKQMDSAIELLRMERAFELTPKGYAAARQQLDILRDRLNGGFTASGLGPMKLEVPAGKPASPSNDIKIINRRPVKVP